ncbi:hypothetical protein [Thauera phenylacetica]|uniref:hypothetical protein n=1 Tax=Thauera phenylacetica TaxID=164400 RepID=UPI0039E3383F
MQQLFSYPCNTAKNKHGRTINAYQGDAMRTNQRNTPDEFTLSCEEFARLNQIKPQSVRARLCRFGSYYGIKPLKLLNGRLAFPAVQVTQ